MVNSFCWIVQSVVDLVAVLVVVHQLVLIAPSVFLILAVEMIKLIVNLDNLLLTDSLLVASYSYRYPPFLFPSAL